jgi:hypothetical protein
MKRARRDMEQGAAAETADRSQAEYFRGLLEQHRAETEQAIAEYLATIDEQKASGDLTGVGELTRQLRHAEQERTTIGQMIAAIDRRFPLAGTPSAPPKPPPAETVHPDGRSLVSLTRRHHQTRVS